MSSPLRSISFIRSSTGSIFFARAGRFSRTFLAALLFMTNDYNTLAGFGRIRAMRCGIARGARGFLHFPHA